MQHPVDHMKDPRPGRNTPSADRSEVAEIWLQSGLPEGFSMEWIFDRYDRANAQAGGRM